MKTRRKEDLGKNREREEGGKERVCVRECEKEREREEEVYHCKGGTVSISSQTHRLFQSERAP